MLRVACSTGAFVRRALVGLVLLYRLGAAHAADRFVAAAGDDTSNDCLTSTAPCGTVGHAIAEAASGDEVKVASGTYQETITVNTSTTLTVSGGWDPSFASRNLGTHATRLARSTFTLSAAAGQTLAVDLDGLQFRTSVAGIMAGVEEGGAVELTVNACGFFGLGGSNCAGTGAGFGAISAIQVGNRGGTIDLVVTRSTFRENRLNSCYPGAVFAEAAGSGTVNVTVSESTFTSNRGSGIYFQWVDRLPVG